MITIYNPTESSFATNGLGVLEPFSCVLSVTINGAWSLELEHVFDEDEKYKLIQKNNIIKIDNIPIVSEQTATYQLYRIYDFVRTLTSVKAIAFPVAFEATYDAIIEELKLDKKTAPQALAGIMSYLSSHGVSKYTVTSDYSMITNPRQKKGSWTDTNLIAAISGADDGSIINHWGGEVAYDNYHIIVNGKLGQKTDYEVRYGKNLTGLSVDTDMSGVVTRLYPLSSDGVRLKQTVSGSEVSYVDSDKISSYPFPRAAFVKTDFKLIDTSYKQGQHNTDTAILTHEWMEDIKDTVQLYAENLWETICAGNTYEGYNIEPEWVQDNLDTLTEGIQQAFAGDIEHPTLKNAIYTAIKEGLAWIKNQEIGQCAWQGSYSSGYTYSNSVRTIKNQYLYVDKRYCYFNAQGKYEPWKDVAAMDWIQPKGSNTVKKFGDDKRYLAKDTYVYTWGDDGSGNQQVNQYWFDADGWWDGVSNTEAEWDWHGSGTAADPYWFGEEGATSEDTNKFAHDCWLYINYSTPGLYYFDEKGYLVDSLTISSPGWDWRETKSKYYFGSTNKAQNKVIITEQWLRIDGQWYYFDDEGIYYDNNMLIMALMHAMQDVMEAGILTAPKLTDEIELAVNDLYDDLYTNLITYCEELYAEGLDLPVINVTANLVDLSKTEEYAGFTQLEAIHLGDSVMVYDYEHGLFEKGNEAQGDVIKDASLQVVGIRERVLGLKYDVLREYNTEVTIGDPSKTVSQITGSSSLGNSGGSNRLVENYVAGQNITIENGVINANPTPGDVYAGDQVSVEQIVTSGRRIAKIFINGAEVVLYGGSDVSITPRTSQGTKIADYSINGQSGSLYAPGGLQYWIETDKKINKLTSVALPDHKTWDCDDEWKTTGFSINFPFWEQAYGYPYMFAKATASLAFGCYSTITWEGNLHYVIILFSAVDEGADIDIYLAAVASDAPYELDGLTFYKSAVIIMPYTSIPAPTDPPPYVKTGHLQYLDYAADHGGEYGTYDETLAYFLEISNFRTRDVYYSGIGNNNEYVIWGGYSKKSNPEITDMPFYVTDDGIVTCTDVLISGTKPIKDIRKNGTSIVDSNQVANITNFTGASSEANGAAGLVPAPLIAEKDKFLKGDGTWRDVSEIEANPSGTATATLEKVEIDGTIYEVGGESNLEDLEDVNINNVVDGEMLIYDEASQKWINGTGGGGTSEIVTNIMSDHSRWDTKVNTSQTAGWALGTDLLGFSCSDSTDVGAQAVYMNAIPATVKKIRFKIDARTNNRPSASTDYDICIGVKSVYNNTTFNYASDTNWIVKKTYSTEQGYFEGELDIVATAPFYLYVLGHSWNLDIQELKLIEYAGGSGGGIKVMLYSRQSGDSEDTITLSEDFDHFDLLVISGRTYVDSGLWHQSNAYICDSLAVGNRVSIGDDGSISWFSIYNKTTLDRVLNAGNPYQITHVMGVKF